MELNNGPLQAIEQAVQPRRGINRGGGALVYHLSDKSEIAQFAFNPLLGQQRVVPSNNLPTGSPSEFGPPATGIRHVPFF
jgi:hypothetical protein